MGKGENATGNPIKQAASAIKRLSTRLVERRRDTSRCDAAPVTSMMARDSGIVSA